MHYERLITSLPLDQFLRLLRGKPQLQARADEFIVSKVQIFGFGIQGPIPAALKHMHHFNVPSPEFPFWRATLPSNVSPGNVPQPDSWSVLCEASMPPGSQSPTASQIEAALRTMGLITSQSKILSVFSAGLDHGYPVPFAGRDRLLAEVQAQLEQLDIYSRGRFGGWRYEVSNQDHSFMQGVEVVDRILQGKPEYTYRKTW